jgi:hypothetical protein
MPMCIATAQTRTKSPKRLFFDPGVQRTTGKDHVEKARLEAEASGSLTAMGMEPPMQASCLVRIQDRQPQNKIPNQPHARQHQQIPAGAPSSATAGRTGVYP